jgi:hypothetical protein
MDNFPDVLVAAKDLPRAATRRHFNLYILAQRLAGHGRIPQSAPARAGPFHACRDELRRQRVEDGAAGLRACPPPPPPAKGGSPRPADASQHAADASATTPNGGQTAGRGTARVRRTCGGPALVCSEMPGRGREPAAGELDRPCTRHNSSRRRSATNRHSTAREPHALRRGHSPAQGGPLAQYRGSFGEG